MNPKLLIVLIVLFLTACAGHTVRDELPASDLDALAMNVQREGRVVLLPNGKDYCAELADTEDRQDACMGDLEDALFNANLRLRRVVNLVTNGVVRLKQQRNPCGWWARMVRQDRCREP